MRIRVNSRVVQSFFETPWAILPAKLLDIQAFLLDHAAGVEYSPEEIAARTAGRPKPQISPNAGVGVLNVMGTISQRVSMMSEISGGSSTEKLGSDLRAMVKSPEVKAIILNIDSPGGSVYGVQELADVVYEARQSKPVYALANSMAASAAYWIGSQASEFYAAPGGEVGSIGVITAHTDASKLYEKEGLTTNLITAGKYKGEGSPFGPLSDETRAAMQERVDAFYGDFVKSVARGRGTDSAAVRGGFGEGRLVSGKSAVSQGMIDGISTFSELVDRAFGASSDGARANVGSGTPDAAYRLKKLELMRRG